MSNIAYQAPQRCRRLKQLLPELVLLGSQNGCDLSQQQMGDEQITVSNRSVLVNHPEMDQIFRRTYVRSDLSKNQRVNLE